MRARLSSPRPGAESLNAEACARAFVIGVIGAYRHPQSRPDDRCIFHEMWRKVRAPSDTAPGNTWGARAHGKCNRKDTADAQTPFAGGIAGKGEMVR